MIRFETGMWARAHGFTKDNTTISNHVTLEEFTEFMLEMETKFGSTWISGLLDMPNNAILIEDMREFAQDLYGESNYSMNSMKLVIPLHFMS